MDLKTIIVFSVLAVAMLIAASQLQTSFTTEVNQNEEEIKINRDIQYEARDINNEFRNTTLDYLSNLTTIVNENSIKIENLEQKILTN